MVGAPPGRVATALLVLVAALFAGCAAPPPATPVGERVRVEQGELRGRVEGTRGDAVLRFADVPFAAPPLGPLRFAPPVPPPRWEGVRDATGPGSRCPQLAAAPGTPHLTAASDDEDCLTLSVTVPAGIPADAGLPVLVWVHGGGFNAGAGVDSDPRRLALAGPMVVVSVNYRLGMLGFLALPGLAGSGGFGLLDQQAALVWVARNAAAFGGDPARVTLAGESAGADSVCAQLTSPAAAGLFAQVILQSGGCSSAAVVDVITPGAGAPGDTWKPLPVAEQVGRAGADARDCQGPRTIECLRALPVDALTAPDGLYWSPAVGTPTLPARPSDTVAAGAAPAVPALAGTVRDEGTLFVEAFHDRAGRPLDAATFRRRLAAAAGGAGPRAAAAGGAYPQVGRSPGRAWADVVTDRAYACPMLATQRALGERAPLYAYEFADETAPSPFAALSGDLADGVAHGAEMPYLFDLVPGGPELGPAQRVRAADLVGRWARFVTTGEPGPGWPAWHGRDGGGAVLTIGAVGDTVRSAEHVAAEHHCDLWS